MPHAVHQTTEVPTHRFLAVRRVEGAVVAVAAMFAFSQFDASWWFFASLILLPDLSMVGYLCGKHVGAVLYNFGHTYICPFVVAAIGTTVGEDVLIQIALVWTAHIGLDRAIGYGLKYGDGFKHTHLSAD